MRRLMYPSPAWPPHLRVQSTCCGSCGRAVWLAVIHEPSADSSSGPIVYQVILSPEIPLRVRALEAVSRQEPTSASLRAGLPAQAGHFDGHLDFAVEAVRGQDLDAAKRHAA